MIRDQNILTELRANWAGVEALRSKLYVVGLASGAAGHFPFALANAAHNLPFLHASSVLGDTLKELANEGHFACTSIFLGALMKASANNLQWQNYELMSKALDSRNGVAHRGELLERGRCWEYIDGIRAELSAWSILTPAL